MTHHPLFLVADAGAALLIAGAWLDALPAIAAGVAAIWYCILIWESDTVKQISGRKKKKTMTKDGQKDQDLT